MTKKREWNKSLVGRAFHSFTDKGTVKWQGFILAEPEKNLFLCQLFEYLMGEPYHQLLVPLSDMKGWFFYDNIEQMRFSYEHGAAYHKRSDVIEKRKKAEAEFNKENVKQ